MKKLFGALVVLLLFVTPSTALARGGGHGGGHGGHASHGSRSSALFFAFLTQNRWQII